MLFVIRGLLRCGVAVPESCEPYPQEPDKNRADSVPILVVRIVFQTAMRTPTAAPLMLLALVLVASVQAQYNVFTLDCPIGNVVVGSFAQSTDIIYVLYACCAMVFGVFFCSIDLHPNCYAVVNL